MRQAIIGKSKLETTERIYEVRTTFFRGVLITWGRQRRAKYPWRVNKDPYRLLIVELMLQRTGVSQVLNVYDHFVTRYPDIRKLYQTEEQELIDILGPLGRNSRYKHFAAVATEIVNQYGGMIPDSFDTLVDLPGLGEYSARAVLCFGFGRRTGLLDPNIYRLVSRYFGVQSGKARPHTDKKMWHLVDTIVPKRNYVEYNEAVIDYGREVCRSTNPRCSECGLSNSCSYRRRELVNQGLRFIDLFAGAGGLSEGFRRAGFTPVFAVEIDKDAAATYSANFGDHVFVGDIADLNELPADAQVICGGPPCQGFSPLGKMSPAKNHAQLNNLWTQFVKVLEKVHPMAFVVENVPEFLKSDEYYLFTEKTEALGYGVDSRVLNAADFGVPQKRKRGFIIGILHGTPIFPQPKGPSRTVRDAIGDLPLEPSGKDWHIGRNPQSKSIERYRCIPPGGNRFDLMAERPDITPECWLKKKTGSTDVFGRLEWDKPALTIRTEFFKPEKGRYLHPEADRPITHREAARLQTFPDDFKWVGSKISVAKQIGNAVPPELAKAVAEAVLDALQKSEVKL